MSQPPEYPLDLRLPDASEPLADEAAHAILTEYRGSVVWKRLRSRAVRRLYGEDALFAIEVGQSIDFDWTWEGATAFRSSEDDFLPPEERDADWKGEVVGLDEAAGILFVWVENPTSPPCVGSFFVRPFEFLACLHHLYNAASFRFLRPMLERRLNATRGGIHPRIDEPDEASLPELRPIWQHSWAILWGPPGTGKTYTVGQQLAHILDDPSERVLVVSTTNKATDGVALSIGRAARDRDRPIDGIVRIGKSANVGEFERAGLGELLAMTESAFARELAALQLDRAKQTSAEEKARLQQRIHEVRRGIKDCAIERFLSDEVRVVVATAFKATSLLTHPDVVSILERRHAPFTTIIIDEAGLISRASAAALSLLASRRIVIVGDSKQLAPISRMSRVLPSEQARWLTQSGLGHLRSIEQSEQPAVHLLREQHRMHPHINAVVSAYQYDDKLETAASVGEREFDLPKFCVGYSRSVWYVLDEDAGSLAHIRADKGPGNRSWVRARTRVILDKLFADGELEKVNGLFLSPFKAQATDIEAYFAENNYGAWTSATIHSQQGAEADFVIFDTVNAGSHAWPFDEWQRLVNVALSRAREFVILLASRAEMRSPFLDPLLLDLKPVILSRVGGKSKWKDVEAKVEYRPPEGVLANPESLGHQIAQRKKLRSVLSREQQQLCGYKMDGKLRLVRGVAGSGKTYVLANWLTRMLQDKSLRTTGEFWVVYANASLHGLLESMLCEAWNEPSPFPWHRVKFSHVNQLLVTLYQVAELPTWPETRNFDYDWISARYLQHVGEPRQPFCDALFIDEAQDMGPHTLRLLAGLVRQTDPDDPKSRSINIFYDNAQNIYGRSTPRWSEIGLDMKGRSTVTKESFRSTLPITEFALNVLYRLKPPEKDADHKELVDRGLIDYRPRDGNGWWEVRFNQVDGPKPTFHKYPSEDAEVEAIASRVGSWIENEGVSPKDIGILYIGSIQTKLENRVRARLRSVNAELEVVKSGRFPDDEQTVVMTTPHSFKGYEKEIIVLAGVDRFWNLDKGVFAHTLYVAMTRSRSVLAIYGRSRTESHASNLLATLEDCLDLLTHRPPVEELSSRLDDIEELTRRIGDEHREWLRKLWKQQPLVQEPILGDDGEILAEPLFWYSSEGRRYACFEKEPSQRARHRFEDHGIEILEPGK